MHDLLEAGVYPKSAPGLVEAFPEEQIRPWLDLYPIARAAGVAKSPGWIVSALRNNYPMERVLAQIDRKLGKSRSEAAPAGEPPAEQILLDDVIQDLRAIGWSDSFAVIEKHWQDDPDRVDAWIDYVVKVFDELNNPAGRLRVGLESGNNPQRRRNAGKMTCPTAPAIVTIPMPDTAFIYPPKGVKWEGYVKYEKCVICGVFRMDFVSVISKTDLSRKTREVFHTVQRGQTVIVESHGQPEAAILDIPDYYILLAAARYHSQHPEIDPEMGLEDQAIGELSVQDRYDLVIAHYLAGSISLSRAAELLRLPWLDLRTRLHRVGLPVRIGPENIDDLRAEMDALTKWQRKNSKGS